MCYRTCRDSIRKRPESAAQRIEAPQTAMHVVVAQYKAPAKIDPRLLDHKVLFQEVEEAPRNMGPDALVSIEAAMSK